MLALTNDAVQAVKGIVTSSPAVPEGGGLRISGRQTEEGELGLELALAAMPAEDDEIVEEEGARVFLESDAADFLADKVLDASVEGDKIQFGISEQT